MSSFGISSLKGLEGQPSEEDDDGDEMDLLLSFFNIAPVLSFRRASSRNRRSLSKSLPNLNALMAPPAPPGLTRNDVRRSILGGPFAIPTASLFITRYIPTRRSYLPRKFSILSALRPSLFKRGFAAHCPFPDFDL